MRSTLYAASTTALLMSLAGPASAGLLDSLLSPSETDSKNTAGAPADVGTFSEPFAEPTITVDGERVNTAERCLPGADGSLNCKPAAGTVANLGDGRFLYLNALEGTICPSSCNLNHAYMYRMRIANLVISNSIFVISANTK